MCCIALLRVAADAAMMPARCGSREAERDGSGRDMRDRRERFETGSDLGNGRLVLSKNGSGSDHQEGSMYQIHGPRFKVVRIEFNEMVNQATTRLAPSQQPSITDSAIPFSAITLQLTVTECL